LKAPKVASLDSSESSRGSSTLAYVAGGVGLVALGVGAYFGASAISKWDERNAHCDETGCDETGLQAGKDTDTYAYISDVGIGVGIIGLGTAAYLLLSGDSPSSGQRDRASALHVVPKVGKTQAGVSFQTRW
jgi:hypothetical protein